MCTVVRSAGRPTPEDPATGEAAHLSRARARLWSRRTEGPSQRSVTGALVLAAQVPLRLTAAPSLRMQAFARSPARDMPQDRPLIRLAVASVLNAASVSISKPECPLAEDIRGGWWRRRPPQASPKAAPILASPQSTASEYTRTYSQCDAPGARHPIGCLLSGYVV